MKFIPLLFVSLFAAVSLSAQQVDTSTQQQFHHHHRQPLFLINGVYPSFDTASSDKNSMSQIRPEDIDKIEVVKDSEAIARFGDIAKDGVILITTKTPTGAGINLATAIENFYGEKLKAALYAIDGREANPDGLQISPNAVKRVEILKKPNGICLNIVTNMIEAPKLFQPSPFKPKPGEIMIRGTASNTTPNNRD